MGTQRPTGDTLKKNERDQFQKFSDGIRNAPNAIFDFGEDKSQNEQLIEQQPADPTAMDSFAQSMQNYIDEKPKTVADGMFKGLLSIGSGVVSGITGIITEPVREVQKKGAIGIVTGMGKGVSGLVTKPLAGVIDMGVKTTQGVINTPGTISRAASRVVGFEPPPPPPPPNPIFGVAHEESLQNAEKLKIVHPTITVISHIRKAGMNQQGIFRESGNVGIIKSICDNYDVGKEPNLDELDMREISGVLKYYLRALPEPLLSFDLYNQFLTVLRSGSAPDRDTLLYKALIKSLPNGNKLLVQSLLALLDDIAKNREVNRMTISNLAIVFGPSLMRPQAANPTSELFDIFLVSPSLVSSSSF